MPESTAKLWVRTPDIYGKPISIHELDYANGTYLAHCEGHPNNTDPFETVIISHDLTHWQHRCSSPEREFKYKNIRITGHKDTFVAVGTVIKEGGNHLVAMTSENGFDWVDRYESPEPHDSHSAYIVKSLGGGVVAASNGKVLFSANLTDWATSEYTGKYIDYDTIDVTYFNSKFYILLKNGDDYAVGYSVGLNEFRYYDLEWGRAIPNCIESNGSQLVIVCSEGLAERCAIFYTDKGNDSDWSRIEVQMPHRSITNSQSDMYSAAWYKDEWVFVGRIREWNNSRTMLFSYAAVIVRSEGDLNPETVLIYDKTKSLDLSYVQNINGKLLAYGQSHPNGESCLYTLE